ncbi:hypothetical protein GY03_12000 [Proteus vulgaris]|uniref:hypothetical protein n=1 Tax=Proteus vulgaris TaxID=585 RepID=UPI0021B15741|nr:hypothetical protein [Proteus vulgaris]MCT6517996.1 hypothetical protein [Proteus vulgaris]
MDKYYLNVDGDNIAIVIDDGIILTSELTWDFYNISISDNLFPDDLSLFYSDDYIGSSHYLSDNGYVFDRHYCLKELSLYVPENNVFDTEKINTLLSKSVRDAHIKIVEPIKFNAISPCDFRCFSENGEYLLCLKDIYFNKSSHIERIKIHNKLEIIFLDGKEIGFMILEPFENIFFDLNLIENKNIKLSLKEKMLFLKYFHLMDESTWNKLNEKDTSVYFALHSIQDEVLDMMSDNSKLRHLNNQLSFILDNY